MFRNLLLAGTLLATFVATTMLLPETPALTEADSHPALTSLRVGLLLQRELEDGSWKQISLAALRKGDQALTAGDKLQLTLQSEEDTHLIVATKSGTRLQILYPQFGYSGAIKSDWAYALPSPHRSYHLDSKAMELLILSSPETLPASTEDRRALLQRTVRGTPTPAALQPVQVALRDGRSVALPIVRYSGAGPMMVRLRLPGVDNAEARPNSEAMLSDYEATDQTPLSPLGLFTFGGRR